MRRALVAALTLAGACGGDDGPPPCTGGLHVCDGALRDADGRTLILRGVNFAGSHKQAPYTDPFTAADFTQLHAWGFNVVRYIIPWAAIEPARGSYDDAYLAQVAERVDWAEAAGIDVVIDLHQDVYGEGFGFDGAPRWTCDESRYAAFVPRDPWPLNYADPNVMACFDALWGGDPTLADAFVAMWQHVADTLGGHAAVIGFDPINEPAWGSYPVATFERDRLQPFYERLIVAIRERAPHWIAFAEPANSRNLGFASSLGPFVAKDVVYAPHLYDSKAETSGGFDPAHAADLRVAAAALRAEADTMGAALWFGEYGGQGTDPNIGAYMDAVYDGAAENRAGTAYWAYAKGGGYDLLDASGAGVPALLDAVVRPAPVRVAGTLTGWSIASSTLQVAWTPPTDPRAAETIVRAPARAFPNGVAVTCDACTDVQTIGDEVHLFATTPAIATIMKQ